MLSIQVVCWILFLKIHINNASYFIDQINDIKNKMDEVSVKLNQFNALFLTSLDEKMVSMIRTLTRVDQSVEALESRAHVWDTFQLHVTAWNEQMGALDKKLDLLNRSQEKIVSLEGKLSSLAKTSERLEEMDSRLAHLERTMEAMHARLGNHLVNEFASKGILQTLKNIDRKFDRVQRMTTVSEMDSILNGTIDAGWISSGGSETDSCPKRDILIKKLSTKIDNLIEYLITTPTNRSHQQQRQHSYQEQLALFEKLKRRLGLPMKKSSRALEALERLEMIVHAHGASLSSAVIRGHECCQMARRDIASFTGNSELLLKRVEAEILGLRHWAKKTEERWDTRMKRLIERKKKTIEEGKIATNYDTLTNTSDDEDIDLDIEIEGSGELPDERWATSTTTTSTTETTTSTSTSATTIAKFEPEEKLIISNLTKCDDVDSSGYYLLSNNRRHCFVDPTSGFAWTIIQQRQNGKVNFTRTWDEYAKGFGSEDEFWIGNNDIHWMTNANEMILRIELYTFEGGFAWAEYNIFRISNESSNFKLLVGGYSGNATDSLRVHSGMAFSTWDRIHDNAPPCCPCAPAYGGGWWFDSCFESNLNGVYYDLKSERETFRGIIWENWLGDYSMKSTKMMVRNLSFEEP